MRMLLDGWQPIQTGYARNRGIDPLEIWSKPSPDRSASVIMQVRIQGDGNVRPWRYYQLICDTLTIPLGYVDWADWCPEGDLLLSCGGKNFRIKIGIESVSGFKMVSRELIDLSTLRFEKMLPPSEALIWSGPTPGGTSL